MIKRVSTKKKSNGVSITKTFVTDNITNNNIKEGEWHHFFPDAMEMSVAEVMDFVCSHYGIHDDVAKHLYFCYTTYNQKKKVKSTVWIDGPSNEKLLSGHSLYDKKGNKRKVEMTDLKLLIHKPKGTVLERNVNCDSTFMLNTVREIGAAVRSKFDYLDDFIPVYLFMDNAGGGGGPFIMDGINQGPL